MNWKREPSTEPTGSQRQFPPKKQHSFLQKSQNGKASKNWTKMEVLRFEEKKKIDSKGRFGCGFSEMIPKVCHEDKGSRLPFALFLSLALLLHNIVFINWPMRVHHHFTNYFLQNLRCFSKKASAKLEANCLDLLPIVTTTLELLAAHLPAAQRQSSDACREIPLNFCVLPWCSEHEHVPIPFLALVLFLFQMLFLP